MEENNVSTITQNESESFENISQETPTLEMEQQQQQQEDERKVFRVKHLHEEKEIPFEEAPTYIQKGLDYDRVKGKYEESKPVISFVEDLARQNGMTVPEYLQAVEEYKQREEIAQLQARTNLDPELAEELYLSRQDRKRREQERQAYELQERQRKEYIDFVTEFPDVNPESIPTDVWQMKQNNPSMSLTDAYIRTQYNQLKSKLNAQNVNLKNEDTSTGSLTGNGITAVDYISRDTFEQNKHDRNWIIKNFERINKSRRNW